MDDKNIIELFFQRSQDALSETAAKYGNYCRKIAENILSDHRDADEAVNEAYLGAWNSIPPHKPENLASYLGRIVRNSSLKIYRRNSALKRSSEQFAAALDELEECAGNDRNAQEQLEMKEVTECINRFLDTLRPAERNVFVCRYWYFDSTSDIAQRFSFSEGKVRSMLFRTRKKLAKALDKEGLL